ncbi:hypothetical protein PC9H_001586 [Pleurotus ostreatus]|uniref:U3 small nucleolar RNA-associated protein 22 n=1 Tax=Pleurotus ostreatus TaxID=5322 RepID=A0A8H7A5Y5_PLEOS|nr:uncharacterized protein PC9H_001586 [Pleurotus ostreatus]KAF7441237.1 hypothetical protein PC9H_001586 [Pleurotus ostreatus]
MALGVKRKRAQDQEGRESTKIGKWQDPEVLSGEDVSDDDYGDFEDLEAGDIAEAEWGGISTEANVVEQQQHSGTKPKKPPTGEELRVIKDATDLFRSSSFKLQIDALLPNVRPKASRIPPLERFLLALHTFITSLPPISAEHPLVAARKMAKKGIAVPYPLPQPAEDTNWKVAFEKPSEITLVGSWANKLSIKGRDGRSFSVDLALEMPNSLFQEKDYLNGRFFHKRAFYLASLASHLSSQKSGLNVSISYGSMSNDPRLTKLILTPNKDDSPNDFTKLNAQICLIPTLSLESPIPLHRLSPSHSNLRVTSISQDNEAGPSNHQATPLYNNAILTCFTPRPHLLAIHALTQIPAFNDALVLLRIWANQRGYSSGSKPCVRGFQDMGPWWAFLLSAVMNGEEPTQDGKPLKRKPLGKGLSSYQLFKAALDFIGKHDFVSSPVFTKTKDGHRFPPNEYTDNYSAVHVDSSSLVNLLAGIPVGSLRLLCYDAQKTLEILDHSSLNVDPFTEVFLKEQRDLMTRCDIVLRVDITSAKQRNESVAKILDHGSSINSLFAAIDVTLCAGLGNRCKAMAILHPTPSSRPLTQPLPSTSELTHIFIGLVLDTQHAFRLVDHGPSADETDSTVIQRFRELWGSKAELRRFKDGRIVESVVWEVKTADERNHVPAMIVQHLLQNHFGIDGTKVVAWQNGFDSMLRLPEEVSSLYQEAGVAAGFRGAIAAFDQVVRSIKALDEKLPLAILNISPNSPYLRYTSVFAPTPLPASLAPLLPGCARYLPHIEFIIEFEKSTRWPDDLRAIQKIKLAFFERIASALMGAVDGLRANVVVGDGPGSSDIQDHAKLEVITKDGWSFAASIWHEREAQLLDRLVENKPLLPHIAATQPNYKPATGKEIREAIEGKDLYLRRFVHGPRHHRAIGALVHQFSAYAGAVRLLKRWLSAHWLLEGHISQEAVEIITASVFVGDGRLVGVEDEYGGPGVPATKERAFSMVVEKLKDWKWEDGMFVPLYGLSASTTAESSVSEVGADAGVPKAWGSAMRAESKKGVWRLSTEMDQTGHIWTTEGPDAVVARRIQALARATYEILQRDGLEVKALFIHPTDDYDFLIKLDQSILPRYAQNVSPDPSMLDPRLNSKYANLVKRSGDSNDDVVRPGFDPAHMLFTDLRRIYADTFVLFHDPCGGDTFGGVWDPSVKDRPRPFRVLGGFSSAPQSMLKNTATDVDSTPSSSSKGKEKELVVLNCQSVLSEIERIGQGLVKEITVQVHQ